MTREEQLDWLYRLRSKMPLYMPNDWVIPMNNALDMAIKALESCEDAVSRQAVLEEIPVLWNGKGDKDYCMETLRDFVTELQPVTPTQNWIPVSESLPKKGEYNGDVAKYYLVQNEYGDMLVARYTHSDYWEQIYRMEPIADEIIAWMPLPAPYKAEMESEE